MPIWIPHICTIYTYVYCVCCARCHLSILTTKYRIHIKAISRHTSGRRRHLSSKCATWREVQSETFGSFAVLNVRTLSTQAYIYTKLIYMSRAKKKTKKSREYSTQISLRHATLMANFLFVSATGLPPVPVPSGIRCAVPYCVTLKWKGYQLENVCQNTTPGYWFINAQQNTCRMRNEREAY